MNNIPHSPNFWVTRNWQLRHVYCPKASSIITKHAARAKAEMKHSQNNIMTLTENLQKSLSSMDPKDERQGARSPDIPKQHQSIFLSLWDREVTDKHHGENNPQDPKTTKLKPTKEHHQKLYRKTKPTRHHKSMPIRHQATKTSHRNFHSKTN